MLPWRMSAQQMHSNYKYFLIYDPKGLLFPKYFLQKDKKQKFKNENEI